jgi:WD40 repeat protein
MSSSSSERDPVEQLADEFLERFRRGERPALTEYTQRYPQWAERIRKVFPALVMMEGARPDTADATGDHAGSIEATGEPRLERLGDYRILREVGRGGMGIVYEAEQESLGRHVALKVLPSHALLDLRHLQRFQREARAAARLHHTNIVPVYGVGEDAGLHYYVMQFIPGLGLDEVLTEVRRLRRARKSPGEGEDKAAPISRDRPVSVSVVAYGLLTGQFEAAPPDPGSAVAPGQTSSHAPEGEEVVRSAPLSRADAGKMRDSAVHLPGQSEGSSLSGSGRPYWYSVARIGIQVAEALAYANSQGVLHRDIKPSNLLLDTQGNVWVTDFGLAKAADSADLTHTGDIVGTLRYLAPERFHGQADVRSDVYALGLTLYEMLTLRPAFDERNRDKLIAQVMQAEPPRPRQLDAGVSRDMETIVLKAMERDPGRRYATAEALADDLKRYLGGEPISARPAGSAERLVRWARRRPTQAGLLAALALLLVMTPLAVGMAVLWRVAEQERGATAFALGRVEDERKKTAVALAGEQAALQKEETAHQDARKFLYFNRILLAEREWWTGNVGHTKELLRECPEQHRGWEWYYLDRQCRMAIATSLEPNGTIRPPGRIDFSPDGQQFASPSHDKTVKIWDAATGQLLRQLVGHTVEVCAVAFHPNGKLLASAGEGFESTAAKHGEKPRGEAKIWDLVRGQEPLSLPTGQNPVCDVVFSPDGNLLATATAMGVEPTSVKLWNPSTGRELRTLGGHTGSITGLAFSPDSRRLASISLLSMAGEVKIWDTQTGAALLTIPGQAMAGSVSFSPDGKHIANDSRDIVRIWDANTGQAGLTLRGHSDSVQHVAYSPDGRFLATASQDGTVKLWNPTTGEEVRTIRGDSGTIQFLAFSADGRRLATGSYDGHLTIWDPATGQDPFTFGDYVSSSHPVAVSADGKWLASGSREGAVKLWDPRTGQELVTLRGHVGYLRNMEFHLNGKFLATFGSDSAVNPRGQSVKIWAIDTGRLLRTINAKPGVFCVSFGPAVDPREFVGPFQIQQEGEWVIWSVDPDHRPRLAAECISPDGQRVVGRIINPSAYPPNPPTIWDARTGREHFRVRGHTQEIWGNVLSPDGRWLASCSDDRTVKIWDMATGEELHTLRGHTREAIWAGFSHDGRRLAATSHDRTVKVWDVATGQEVLTLRGSGRTIFSPDGQWIARGGTGVKLWETAPLTPELRLQREAAALVNRLAVEPLPKEDIVERLRSDRTLNEALREQALALVERHHEDPYRFHEASWAVVQKPGAEAARYQTALRQAKLACDLASVEDPSHPQYVNTLGVAQYRVGKGVEALANLTKADTLFSARSKGGEPSNLAFLALAQHRLGHKDEAQNVLVRLGETMKLRQWANNALAQACVREAETLLQAPTK